jgi:hypothetical protein
MREAYAYGVKSCVATFRRFQKKGVSSQMAVRKLCGEGFPLRRKGASVRTKIVKFAWEDSQNPVGSQTNCVGRWSFPV